MRITPQQYAEYCRCVESVWARAQPTSDTPAAELAEINAQRAVHGAIGLSTEAGELLLAAHDSYYKGTPRNIVNIAEELGDLMFYATTIVDAEFGPDELENLVTDAKSLFGHSLIKTDIYLADRIVIEANNILDLYKRRDYYKIEIPKDKLLVFLLRLMVAILDFGGDLVNAEQIMVINQAKLRRRYPNKFNTSDAETRDLVEEAKTIKAGLPI